MARLKMGVKDSTALEARREADVVEPVGKPVGFRHCGGRDGCEHCLHSEE